MTSFSSLNLSALPVLALLLIWVSLACSPDQSQDISIKAPSPDVVKIREFAVASVLITERPEATTPTIESIRVSPASVVVDPGDSVQLSATALSADGQALVDVEFVWNAVDPRAGSITREGDYQAGVIPGVYDNSISVTAIQNTPDGIEYASEFAAITVVGDARLAKLASVVIVPFNPIVLKQQIYTLRAFGFDPDGVVIPGVSFVWKVTDPSLGRVNELGYLTVEGDEGTYRRGVSVTGIWEGESVSVTSDIRVTIAPKASVFLLVHALPQRFFLSPGDRLQLRAVALNGLGELVTGTELRWDMVSEAAGSIDGEGNFIASSSPGIYTNAVQVEAFIPGEKGLVRAVDYASLVIREEEPFRRLHTMYVQPASVKIAAGERAILLVRAIDSRGQPVNGFETTWEVLTGEAGTVSAVGGYTAGEEPGVYPEAVRATVVQTVDDETVSKYTSVDVVVTGTLVGSEVHPALATLAPGKTVHFSLTGWDENDIHLPGLVVLWSVSDESIGDIDAFGNFTASGTPGLYQDAIRAEVIQTLPAPP